jgi:hypothetical protein
MSLAQEYRLFADECLEWAKSANTDYEREIYLNMARDWLAAATSPPLAPSDSDASEPGYRLPS